MGSEQPNTDPVIVTVPPGAMGVVGWEKWANNGLKLLSVPAIIYFGFVLANIQADGFQVSDFYFNDVVIGSILTYILSTLLDFFQKLTREQKYIVE